MHDNGNTTRAPSNGGGDALRARIVAMMRREDITQRALAKSIGCSQTTINFWIMGDRELSPRLRASFVRWADALDAKRAPWHPADIKAALYKRDASLASLARTHGLTDRAFSAALRKANPIVERMIADFLEVDPSAIWPDRYDAHGEPRATRDGRPS